MFKESRDWPVYFPCFPCVSGTQRCLMASSLLLETQDSLLATAHPLISLETQLGTLTVIIFPHLILLLEYFIH
jgi:hypothetical protein